MRPRSRRRLLWKGLGVLFYFAGLFLFLALAVSVFVAPPEGSLENLSAVHLPFLLLSVLLIGLGGTITWKFGDGHGWLAGRMGLPERQEPQGSTLEQLGYHVPPEPSEDDDEFVYEDGTLYLLCSECGARNEREFDYCSHCSTELPDPE